LFILFNNSKDAIFTERQSFWIFTAQALYSDVWLTGSNTGLVSQLAQVSRKWKAIAFQV